MRDEFFAERKERERLQSQKDKTKRELEAAQSRIASLQEQVLTTEFRTLIALGKQDYIEKKINRFNKFDLCSYRGFTYTPNASNIS